MHRVYLPVSIGGACAQDLTLLSNGAVLLWFSVRSAPNGKAAVQGLLSFDQGRSWSTRRLTLTDDLPRPYSTYPSTARLGDGMLCTVYYQAGTEEKSQDMYIGGMWRAWLCGTRSAPSWRRSVRQSRSQRRRQPCEACHRVTVAIHSM